MSAEASTPLMRQYNGIKQQVPNALLMFRLGDFYELFFEDAVTAARELEITLTSRNKEKGAAIPMCGVPYHAAEGLHRAADPEGLPGGHLRPDGRPAAGQEAGEARDDAHGDAGHGDGRQPAALAREQLPGGGGAGRRPRRAWRTWIFRPASSASTEMDATEVPAALEQLAAREVLVPGDLAPAAAGERAPRFCAPKSKTGSSARTTPTARCAIISGC